MSNYFLRNKANIAFPVKMKLSDTELMSHLAQDSQPTPRQGQVRYEPLSDAEGESNELEQSGTDGEASDLEQDQGQTSSDTGNSALTTQDVINQEILEQLSAIGSRLEKLEYQTCRKNS